MKNFIKSRSGSALSFVIVALLVVVIMMTIVAILAQTNITQASAQEKGLQAYYAARSGAELAYGALWVTDSGGVTLLKALKNGTTYPTNHVDFGNAGTADVSVSYKLDSVNSEEVVTIQSTGQYGNISKPVTLKVYFEIDSTTGNSALGDIVWSK